MFRRIIRPALAALAACASVQSAAADTRAVGAFKDWQVFTENVQGDTICYATTAAVDKAPKNVNHGPVNFYVASWKSGRSSGQPSLRVGYELRQDMPPEAQVNSGKWRMFAAGEEAFLEDRFEKPLINALKRGSELRVEAVSMRNTRSVYHFSLNGSSAAIDKAQAVCR